MGRFWEVWGRAGLGLEWDFLGMNGREFGGETVFLMLGFRGGAGFDGIGRGGLFKLEIFDQLGLMGHS